MVLDHILRTNDILDKLILLFSWWCLYLKLISEALYWVIHHSRASTIKLTIELYLSFAELADHLRRFSRQQITSYTLVWLQCGLNSGVPADIHCAPHVPFSGWHCLEVIVSPAFLILAQMSLYLLFPQHDFFLSFFFLNHKGFSLIVVLIMELSWSIIRIYTFCFYICDWLKHLQDLTNIYVFKYRLLISLHISNWSQTISHMLNSSIKQGKKKNFSPLTICLFEVHFFSEKQKHYKDVVDASDFVRNCLYAFREQWWRYRMKKVSEVRIEWWIFRWLCNNVWLKSFWE